MVETTTGIHRPILRLPKSFGNPDENEATPPSFIDLSRILLQVERQDPIDTPAAAHRRGRVADPWATEPCLSSTKPRENPNCPSYHAHIYYVQHVRMRFSKDLDGLFGKEPKEP